MLFISLSIILAAFCAVWAIGQYQVDHHVSLVVTAVAALLSVGGLAVYAAAFQRKTRNL